MMRNTHKQCGTGISLVACLLVLAAGVGTGRADEAASSLDKYNRPVDAAVTKGLEYLVSLQQDDGSFDSPMEGNAGVTGLCVMAFLARGYTPGNGPYGEVINRGVDFILDKFDEKSGMLVGGGRSHGPMYSHGISTLLLSEVSGMVDEKRQERIDAILPRAMQTILEAQRVPKGNEHKGGWRYKRDSRDSDISCSGWCVLALRSARGNGAAVPLEAIKDAVAYIKRLQTKEGGFGYQRASSPGVARTGVGLLCMELLGHHGEKATIQAGEWLLKHLPRNVAGTHFYYGIYYAASGMFQLGGKYWEQFAAHLYETMLPVQEEDGSWPEENRAGKAYSTAMTILGLSVSYRQLPIYQR